jgi:predicted RecA/RadA family phage recombinase
MPKAAGLEIKPGEKVYWNAAGGVITKTDTDALCGRCHEYAAPGDIDVKVELENGAGL